MSQPKHRDAYADRDEGDLVFYTSTHGLPGTEHPESGFLKKSIGTRLLDIALKKGTTIMVFRSSEMPRVRSDARDRHDEPVVSYRPYCGFRYDGLYKPVGRETLDRPNAVYRYPLRREPGQGPIRSSGPGVRPDLAERAAMRDIVRDDQLAKGLSAGQQQRWC